MLEHFAVAFAAHAAFYGIEHALKFVAEKRPDLEEAARKASAAKDVHEIDKVFEQAVGVIIAEAAAGNIRVDKAVITALRGVKFDHQNGTVNIEGSTVSAATLFTGGSAGASGKTIIGGNTRLASQGTSIDIGYGASIVITGDASIKQT